MPGAQVAVADYRPAWWPTNTTLLIRRLRLSSEQISGDPRARRRRTLHPDQRALPIEELADTDTVFRDAKHKAALCHPLSGYERVNRAWMRAH